jgi:hypothetical protein
MDSLAWSNLTGSVIPQFLELYQNVLGVVPAYDASAPAVKSFFAAYQARPLIPSFSTAFGKSPNIVSLLTYDAVFAFANAWNRSIEVMLISSLSRIHTIPFS